MADQDVTSHDELVSRVLKNDEIPKFYFNGYSFGFTPTDVSVVLKSDDKPIAYLKMSHSIGKTLALALIDVINRFENDTKMHVYTIDEITTAMKKKDS